MRTARTIGAGLLLGVAWGVLARVWMRLVSDNPSFSWEGTLFILGLAGWFGVGLGVVAAARQRRGSRWWRLAVLPTLLLFAGPGILFLPPVVIGGFAASGRGPVALRMLAGVVAAGAPVAFVLATGGEVGPETSPVVSFGGFLVLGALLALGASLVWRRWPDRARVRSRGVPAMA
jgi:hypothetical protein